MTIRSRSVSGVMLVATVATLSLPGIAWAQFGKGLLQSKTEVTLVRRLPPKVIIPGPSLKVEVVSRVGRDGLAERFRSAVEAQLAVNDAGVKLGQPEADTLVHCTITRLDINQTAGSRLARVTKQTGTKQELNSKTGKMETKPVYETVYETRYFTTVAALLRVEVRVRVVKTGALIGSRTYSPTSAAEYAAGLTPQESQIESALVSRGVFAAAAVVTPAVERPTVLLARPNNDVDDRNKLAGAGQWSRMADELERMKPLSDLKKDAYRLYNIALANEAQAYATTDLAATRRFLERASAMYALALERKPDEEYFQPPIARITESKTSFDEFERQLGIIAAGGSLPDLTPSGGADSAAATTAAETPGVAAAARPGMTNTDVIDLVRAGLSEENLIAAIKDAKTVRFDLSVEGLKALMAGKVPNVVVAAMRAR
jgi:hypothetical protein